VAAVSKYAAALALLLALSCHRGTLAREGWQRMSRTDKTLYVRSLLGHEKAQQQKGGHSPRHAGSPEAYVARIDQAYAGGEQRDVDAVFAALP
jgi:hypothetical protein